MHSAWGLPRGTVKGLRSTQIAMAIAVAFLELARAVQPNVDPTDDNLIQPIVSILSAVTKRRYGYWLLSVVTVRGLLRSGDTGQMMALLHKQQVSCCVLDVKGGDVTLCAWWST